MWIANRLWDPTRIGSEAVKLDSKLRERIVGQDQVIEQIVHTYQTYLAGMSSPELPIGNLLFLGPTDSGKTGMAKAVAESLLGNAGAVVKIDCAEFSHSHEIAKCRIQPLGGRFMRRPQRTKGRAAPYSAVRGHSFREPSVWPRACENAFSKRQH